LERHLLVRRFQPGEFLFWEGERSQGFWFIVEGSVRIFKLSPDGRTQVICTAQRNTCLGCPLFAAGSHLATAQAASAVTAVVIAWEHWNAVIDEEPRAGLALLRLLGERHRVLGEVAATLALRCVASRVARVLVTQMESTGDPTLLLSHEEVAALAGTAREVVTRALRDLRRRGIIALGRRRIVVQNETSLRQTATQA
jgi:CRP/FNR family transcriptional regulator